ncbi:Ribosomal large subunit pseudouridine synthase A [Pseudovibrio axinellae]|uniref:Dual-specificity RNA pseudouridine synthase RluA n=1 Tax=Pseudovibrio axinellae TaxID=989403 RepID=A0A161X9N7_9HYPH|nr:pseudouridine synthase [Pseudovibrio axinellae]KZL09418.1 Ribosomal large subunit pseudouridine synthase A [Pseudovibrio axinellae]SEQ65519.1 tRNA pseudouridine32 synthase / 23S rRNA pseudouridine746 synthase [Pseudovibrio axinellae]
MNSPSAPFIYAPPTSPFLTVVHHDEQLLVLNKPSGLLSVPGRAEAHKDCLEARAQSIYPTATTVHRLDMDTSGLLVMAMNKEAHRHVGLQFEKRMTRKTYIARIWGHPGDDAGEVNLPLRCDWPNRPKQMVDHELGRSALTRWEVMSREEKTTLMKLMPVTGRSHQLRVHMLALGHPIVGDRLYAEGEALSFSGRLNLHAQTLELRHPIGGEYNTFTAACPFFDLGPSAEGCIC